MKSKIMKTFFLAAVSANLKFNVKPVYNNVVLNIAAVLKTIEKDGHKFWKPTKVDYTYDLVEKVHMRLENLFGGDKVAAEPVAKLFDEQWKEVIAAFGAPLIEKIISEYVKIIEEFLLKLPIEEVAN